MASYRLMREKWNIDAGGPGHFKRYLVDVNSCMGPLTQFYPARLTIFLDGSRRTSSPVSPGCRLFATASPAGGRLLQG
jgi:hypothetical protein